MYKNGDWVIIKTRQELELTDTLLVNVGHSDAPFIAKDAGLYWVKEMFNYSGKKAMVYSVEPISKLFHLKIDGLGIPFTWCEEFVKPCPKYIVVDPIAKNPEKEYYISALHEFLINDVKPIKINFDKEENYNTLKLLAEKFIDSDAFVKEGSTPYTAIADWFTANKTKIIKLLKENK